MKSVDAMLFGFAVRRMLAALAAELLELQPLGRLLFILRRKVITIFAVRALKDDFISHNDSLQNRRSAFVFLALLPT